MQVRTRALVAITAIAGLGTALPMATAADLGYSYGELRYLESDLGNDRSADGVSLIGWYRLHPNVFITGQLNLVDIDTGADGALLAVGGGYIQPLNDQWDAVAMASYRRNQVKFGSTETTDDGVGIQLGFRGMPIPKFETRAFVNHVRIAEPDTSLFLSGDYWFSPVLSVGLAAEFGGDADTISLGARYAFGN